MVPPRVLSIVYRQTAHGWSWLWRVWASVLLIASWSSRAQAAFEFRDESWEGTSELLELARQHLGEERVKLVAALDYSTLTPRDAVIVLHPETRLDYEEVGAFLRAGGRLAVLDDHGRGAELLSRFQIHRVGAPLQPKLMLRQNQNLAIAVPAVQVAAGVEQGRHPIVADVQRVITNHPTALSHPDLTPVLRIEGNGEPDVTLAVTGIIERGRLFAMGDPSAVINLMLRYPGNRSFATGLVAYLVEDDVWGARNGNLYLVANDFRQLGHYGGDTTLAQELTDYVDGAREAIQDIHNEGLPEILAVLLAMALVVGATVWTVLVSSRVYKRGRPRYAASVPLVAQGGVAGRAAVLAAPTTKGALVVLELKAALEEGIAHALGLPPGITHAHLVDAIEASGALDQHRLAGLRGLLREMARVETSIAAAQPTKVRAEHVQSMSRQVKEYLEILQGYAQGKQ